MESQRNFIVIGLAVVTYFLFLAWQEDYAPIQTQTTIENNVTKKSENTGLNNNTVVSNEMPNSTEVSTYSHPESTNSVQNNIDLPKTRQNRKTSSQNNLITLESDVLRLKINPQGGDIVSAELLAYPQTQNVPDQPIQIIKNNNGRVYIATSGLIGEGMPESTEPRALYSSSATSYKLHDNDDSVQATLRWINDKGVEIVKIFSLSKGVYVVNVNYQINNRTNQNFTARFFAQLKRDQVIEESKGGGLGIRAYQGAAYSTKEQRYERYDFDDMNDANLSVTTKGGWVAYLQHYFISAWIPDQETVNTISSLTPGGMAIIRVLTPEVRVNPGDTVELGGKLYVGPKIQDDLEKIADGLDLTVDYGFLWWIGQPLFWLLKWFESIIGSWGLAIIMVTITVKSIFYPLSNAQYRSFAKMRTIQPKINALKERIGDDRQKMSQAMMELYKKEKVNPLGGCLPLIVQMPVFIALYWVLIETVELRHAEFYLWIHDLSAKDPYFILPLIYGASMFLMQKMQPTAATMDPMQQKIMQFMPVMITGLFLFFPSGLVLYWVVNNLISISQQLYVTRKIEAEVAAKQAAHKKS